MADFEDADALGDDPVGHRVPVSACHRVKKRGGVIHTFCVGQVLEQPNVDWLKAIGFQVVTR